MADDEVIRVHHEVGRVARAHIIGDLDEVRARAQFDGTERRPHGGRPVSGRREFDTRLPQHVVDVHLSIIRPRIARCVRELQRGQPSRHRDPVHDVASPGPPTSMAVQAVEPPLKIGPVKQDIC